MLGVSITTEIAILNRFLRGVPMEQLAREYGLTMEQIKHIVGNHQPNN